MAEGPDKEERTESATPQRKEEARQKGQVAKSMELTSSTMFLIGLTTIWAIFPSIFVELSNIMEAAFKLLGDRCWSIDPGHTLTDTNIHHPVATIQFMGIDVVKRIAKVFAPFMIVMFVSALAINLVQVGFLISGESLIPKFDRINVVKGVTRMVSTKTIVMFLQSMLKIFLVGYVLYITMRGEQDTIMAIGVMPIKSAISEITRIMFKMGIRAAIFLFTLSAFDYIYQRWEYEKNLRMTKQEIKQETKQHEGDPQIKSRIRGIQREMAQRRMMEEVPTASVVITNPTHIAVALKYDVGDDNAPSIVAKGERIVAERIKEIAREHNVPIVEDKPLARVLYKLELGQEIPAMLYKAVAEILARVIRK